MLPNLFRDVVINNAELTPEEMTHYIHIFWSQIGNALQNYQQIGRFGNYFSIYSPEIAMQAFLTDVRDFTNLIRNPYTRSLIDTNDSQFKILHRHLLAMLDEEISEECTLAVLKLIAQLSKVYLD